MQEQEHGPLALIVTPDRAYLTFLAAGLRPMLTELKATVGGWIEAIGGPGWCCYVNEHGKRLGQPPNPAATQIARQLGFRFGPGDMLAGPAVFLGREASDEASVPDIVLTAAATVLGGDGLTVEPDA
jgi:hypothetical protein